MENVRHSDRVRQILEQHEWEIREGKSQSCNAPSCNMCGRRHNEVFKLIAGPDFNICDECVELCSDIVEEARSRSRNDQT